MSDIETYLRQIEAGVAGVRQALSQSPAPSTPAPSTPAPSPTPFPTAASRLGWGKPTWSDDFSAGLDTSKWQNSPANGMPGHAQNGRRIASSAYVQDGVLKLYGKSNGDTAWLRQKLSVTYGRWELRFRSRSIGRSGEPYHVLALIWPSTERWPHDGEYDFLENMAPGQQKVGAFLHYPHPSMPVEQEYREFSGVDTREWTTVAFEWSRNGLKGWVNGKDWYSVSGGANSRRSAIQAMPKGSLTLQLDNFTGNSGLCEALYEVDYVNYWAV